MASEKIKRRAFGHSVKVGDLYDACSESFLGRSVLKKQPPPSITQVMNTFNANTLFVRTHTFDDKTKVLQIVPELQMSLIAGLVNLSGSGNWLQDRKQSARGVCCSLLHSIETKTEILNLFSSAFKKCADWHVLRHETQDATHIVAEIRWGATSIVTMEHPNDENCEVNKIIEDLQVVLTNMTYSPYSCDHSKLQTIDNQIVSIRTFNDVLLPHLAKQYCDGKLDVIEKLRESVAWVGDKKGIPQSLLLIPLVQVWDYLNIRTVNKRQLVLLPVSLIERFDTLFEQFTEIKQEFQDLLSDVKQHQACISEKDTVLVEKSVADIGRAKCHLKSELAKLLVQVRCGAKDTKQLDMLEKKFKATEPGSLQSFLSLRETFSNLNRKMSVFDFFTKHEIVFVGRNSSFGASHLRTIDELYILLYSEDAKQADIELWNDNKNYFLDLIQSRKTSAGEYDTMKTKQVVFAVIDTELHPEIVMDLNDTLSLHMSHYRKGKCIERDVFQSYSFRQGSGRIRSCQPLRKYSSTADNLKVWLAACPGSVSGHCTSKEIAWFCDACDELIEHCLDDFLYCKCSGSARGLKSEYLFRCNDPKHGSNFIQFASAFAKKIIPTKELNILVLGETGVGKSTWINAVANYLSFSSLEEAKAHELICLIGTSFTVMDDNFKEKVVKIGDDSNENIQVGQSATQCPKVYVFQWNDVVVRLIDTPGIGDTHGMAQDVANFEKILQFISEFKELHGICILLKPNNARLDVMFKFCIKELLTYLHSSCSHNIVFCFTNARSTLYRPGESFPALKKMLQDNMQVDIVLSKDTIYCFDNESFRSLCMFHRSIQSNENQLDLYSSSWDKSVAETKRLFNHVLSLKAHVVQDTVSLNDTKRLISQLTKPIVSMTQNILTNIAMVEEKKLEIRCIVKRMETLTGKLVIPALGLIAVPLTRPRTVCTSSKCVKYYAINNLLEPEYITHCHNPCFHHEVYGCYVLQSGYCIHCGCEARMHIHITYEQKFHFSPGIDSTVAANLNSCKSDEERAELYLKELCNRQKLLEEEKQRIMGACVKLGSFINSNSLVQTSDAFEENLATCTRLERDKCMRGGDKRVLEGLEKMCLQYKENSAALKASRTHGAVSQMSPGE